MQLFVLTLNPCIFLIKAPQTLYGHLSLCYHLTAVINTLMCLFHPDSRILFQPGPCMQTGKEMLWILLRYSSLWQISAPLQDLPSAWDGPSGLSHSGIGYHAQPPAVHDTGCRNKKHDQCDSTDRAMDDR